MRKTFIMFFLRDQAQANAVKDTGIAPWEKQGGLTELEMTIYCG